jgi:hypothetical protein
LLGGDTNSLLLLPTVNQGEEKEEQNRLLLQANGLHKQEKGLRDRKDAIKEKLKHVTDAGECCCLHWMSGSVLPVN